MTMSKSEWTHYNMRQEAAAKEESRRDLCVKACEGFADPMELRRQRDKLLEWSNEALHHIENGHSGLAAMYLSDAVKACKGESK